MSDQPNEKSKLILLSSGGTGGHISPARALGHDLMSRGFRVEIMTDERGKKYETMFEGMKTHVVKSGTLGKGLLGKIMGAANLGIGIVQAMSLVKSLQPTMVIGFGGYPSVPGVFAAQKLKIPTVIHEQNAIIGKANAFLAPKAERIALSLPSVTGLDENDKMRSVVTGNPVREEIAALYTKPYPILEQDGVLRILVLGGSQAATVFNEVLPEALSSLSSSQRAQLEIVQQCQEKDIDDVKKSYDAAGIKAELATFFDDVAGELEKAHLVIARSGASTVAEVTTAGRPAIFVPYPHHKDQQQKMNADAVADTGGAWVMTESGFTPEAILARIETFLQNPETLFRAAENARSCGKPDAARKLGNLVTAIASGWGDK
ncbi:MAG: UDP-N-acetylglucosamine--N-acetylmuramyl-(pentapeptide) pyrophosphoryl-undecaprenol N-acetylglucosamine transferase [Micavibrio sp.]|nr:MAG: UDP-N-acetylglucosamine--N-acetylmuramyl-(pentapeptide) pyrophosphoryl-undecaprenol N-acetylglucosamine transferase [Micavibrio sp.]